MIEGLKALEKVFYDLRQLKETFNEELTALDEERYEEIKQELERLTRYEKLFKKYDIEDILDLDLALYEYYHRYDSVETRRVNINE